MANKTYYQQYIDPDEARELALTLHEVTTPINRTVAPSTLELSVSGLPAAGVSDSKTPTPQRLSTNLGIPETIVRHLPSPLTSSITINAPGPFTLPLTMTVNSVTFAVSGTAVFPETLGLEAEVINNVSITADTKRVLMNTIEAVITANDSPSGPTIRPTTFELIGTALKEGSGSGTVPPFGLNVLRTLQAFDYVGDFRTSEAWGRDPTYALGLYSFRVNWIRYTNIYNPSLDPPYEIRSYLYSESAPDNALNDRYCTKFTAYFFQPDVNWGDKLFNLLLPFANPNKTWPVSPDEYYENWYPTPPIGSGVGE